MDEYLRRIDEKDYLTEREHREFRNNIEDRLKVLDILIKYNLICLSGYLCESYKELLVALIQGGVTDKDDIPSEEEYKIVHNWIEENDIDIDMI